MLCRLAPVGLALLLALGCSPAADEPPPAPVAEPRLPVAFAPGFLFGFATVGWQSEGVERSDGTVVTSNWSEWQDLGKIKDGTHNDRGNGFHDHYETDLALCAGLGANAFSYAIDWARLEPKEGVFDDVELGLVVDKVKAMRAHGLRPVVVLFHWVTPTWVQSPKSGVDMLAKSDHAIADAFVALVKHVVPALAPLVDDWVTFEEPYSIVAGEYVAGEHPPGKFLDIKSASYALVNLMYLHAGTYHAVKALDTVDADGDGVTASVGMENLATYVTPLDETSEEDKKVAVRFDYILNQQFLNGIWNGDIDVDMDGKADNASTDPPERHDATLARTLDFIGLNYYERLRVRSGGALGNIAPFWGSPVPDVRSYDPRIPHSDMYQEISAHGLRVVIEEYSRWGLPLYITETGLGDADDDQRPYYILEHFYQAARAAADGYDVRGLFWWTISDNFEWAEGQGARFGVNHVDFTTPAFTRTPLASASAYSDIAHQKRIDQALWGKWSLPQYPPGIP